MGETGVLPVLIGGPALGGATYGLGQVALEVVTAAVASLDLVASGVAVGSEAPVKEDS